MADQMLLGLLSCPFCGRFVSAKSSLNRHYASCKSLKEILTNEPEKISSAIIDERRRQLEIIENNKEKQRTKQNNLITASVFIACSQCGDCLIKRDTIMSHVCKNSE